MKIAAQFKATLQKSPNRGGWTYVVWPDSVKFFGTRGLVATPTANTDTSMG